MKKEFKLGIVAAGYLAVSVGANAYMHHEEMKQQVAIANKQTAVMQQVAMEMKSQMAVKAADQKFDTKNIVNADRGKITEMFNITQIDDKGYVHGEPYEGSGEGIYYSIETFKQMGAGAVKVGDTVDVTWNIADYQNENWDNIQKIQIVL